MLIFILMLIAPLAAIANDNVPNPCLCVQKRLAKNDSRYATFVYALKLMKERNVKTIVETGTTRGAGINCSGDGCSTLIFADWVRRTGGEFYSVDIDLQALKMAEKGLGSWLRRYAHLVQCDSVAYLKNFNRTIDFLYLDSYDFDAKNPTPSQQHHLNEIVAAYPFLTKKSVVMIDDCDLPHGGKGKLVIEHLQSKGWKIVAKKYQVIMVQE
jgi:hypothetical protein